MNIWNRNKSSQKGILSGKELRSWIKEREQEKSKTFGDSDVHPLWHVVLFIGLLVIFFPWSLLLLLLLFGWDGSVQIFRGLVIGTIGLVVFLLWLAIWLAILILIIALLAGA